ncbi:hypothetical protein TcasGA2_TC016359 [Tribolium castaneum]|uniref:Uncharacterized protein n=1 Tax=Tribolium castaneum TaxID=7070 RepID=D6WPB0_TRICA|nr:PREDICTED: uncharacterized protein LOC107398230 [Tribolium castaneum]EFA07382.1 hypothetical protein TcasGA2_TC016359 [Tribolium castaneum]|eukprot:XP_015837083.1 PREDICTED: uncharacterized protein LOC107398230 [Tribolium castaneum]
MDPQASSVGSFDDEVDNCVKNNYSVFLSQAMANIKRKYPHLREDHVKCLAMKMIVVVKENFKLNQGVTKNDEEKKAPKKETDLRKYCLTKFLRHSNTFKS